MDEKAEAEEHSAGGGFEFRAFISYSHLDNRSVRLSGQSNNVHWADWLYDGLMAFRTPAGLVGQVSRYNDSIPPRTWPVFRDTNELPTAATLSEAISSAIDASATLIVLCSPRSANSHYVNEEVRRFKANGGSERILAVILDGEPNAAQKGRSDLECFPAALRHGVGTDGQVDFSKQEEPIAADLRDPDNKCELDATAFRSQDARLAIELKRIVAGIIGVAFGKLVDWEEMARLKAADDLVGACEVESKKAESLSPSRDQAQILQSLIKREGLLESAVSLSPKDENISTALGSARRNIFELALATNDLGLASYYLQKGQASADFDRDATSHDWAKLNEAWNRSDPARSPALRRAFICSAAVPAVAVAAANGYYFLIDSNTLTPFALVGCTLVVVISAALSFALGSVRLGNERALRWASVLAYWVCIASIPALNPLTFVLGGAIVRWISGDRVLRLNWRSR